MVKTMTVKKPLTKSKIIMELQNHRDNLKKFEVKRIGLFGSYLNGKQTKRSDIDILVGFNKINFDNYMDLKLYLEKTFKKKVDLVIEEDLKPDLRYVIEEAAYVKGL